MKHTLATIVVAVFVTAGCEAGQGVATGAAALPSPVPMPTASPLSSASSAPSASVAAAVPLGDGPLSAGTYLRIHERWDCSVALSLPGCSDSPVHGPIRISFTVPDGWAGIEGEAIWLVGEHADAPHGASLLFGPGAWLLSDPCQNGQDPDIRVGPTVDDFANALADHPLLDVTTPVDVELAGYSGKYLDLQVPSDISMCEAYRPWEPGLYAQGPGHRWHLWILDVGGARVVIQSTDYAGTSAQHRSELQAIVDSIRIEP